MAADVSADVRIVDDAGALVAAAAALFAEAARTAIAARGVFRVALSGGSTPRALYHQLAQPVVGETAPGLVDPVNVPPADSTLTTIDWARVHLFFGDERFVPSDHPESNYRMVRETGLAGLAVPEAQVHRVPTELGDPQATADRYAQTLREQFGTADGEWPRFDLVLLGMGDDGHTASLFPGTDVLHETRRAVAAVWVERLKTWRITLTTPVLNHARQAALLVSGAGKADTLAAVLEGPDPQRYPVQGIRPGGQSPIWLVDRAAAAKLSISR